MPHLSYTSPVGPLSLFEEDHSLVAVDWGWPPTEEPSPLLEQVREQLTAYFAKSLHRFDLPLRPHGTPFQLKVWQALLEIPWGQTLSYGEFARQLGTSPRAIGGAVGRNPLPIIIPCHRIIAKDCGLGGYSGWDGVETKRFLLHLEGLAY